MHWSITEKSIVSQAQEWLDPGAHISRHHFPPTIGSVFLQVDFMAGGQVQVQRDLIFPYNSKPVTVVVGAICWLPLDWANLVHLWSWGWDPCHLNLYGLRVGVVPLNNSRCTVGRKNTNGCWAENSVVICFLIFNIHWRIVYFSGDPELLLFCGTEWVCICVYIWISL